MSRTVADVVTEVRMLLQDADEDNYRHSDEAVISAINVGLADIRRLRPDLYLPSSYSRTNVYSESPINDYNVGMTTPIQYVNVADLSANPLTEFPIEDAYVPSMIEYTVGYISMSDDEYTSDGRAAALLGRFAAKLGGV